MNDETKAIKGRFLGQVTPGDFFYSTRWGVLKRHDGEMFLWISKELFDREGLKKDLALTLGLFLAMEDSLKNEGEFRVRCHTMLESLSYAPIKNEWWPQIGGYFLVPKAHSNFEGSRSSMEKPRRWWQVFRGKP